MEPRFVSKKIRTRLVAFSVCVLRLFVHVYLFRKQTGHIISTVGILLKMLGPIFAIYGKGRGENLFLLGRGRRGGGGKLKITLGGKAGIALYSHTAWRCNFSATCCR